MFHLVYYLRLLEYYQCCEQRCEQILERPAVRVIEYYWWAFRNTKRFERTLAQWRTVTSTSWPIF